MVFLALERAEMARKTRRTRRIGREVILKRNQAHRKEERKNSLSPLSLYGVGV